MSQVPSWLQIHAKLQLAAVGASAVTFLLTLQPAPSLEKKMLSELQTNPWAPISRGIQWTFHQLDVYSATRSVNLAFLRFLNGDVLRTLLMYSFPRLCPACSTAWLSDNKHNLQGKIRSVLAYQKCPNRQGTSATNEINTKT